MQHGKSAFENGLDGGTVEVADRELGSVVEGDGGRADGADVGEVDQIGTVDPQEAVGRQLFRETAETVEDDERLRGVGQVYLNVLAHAFNVADFVRRDKDSSAIRPE